MGRERKVDVNPCLSLQRTNRFSSYIIIFFNKISCDFLKDQTESENITYKYKEKIEFGDIISI